MIIANKAYIKLNIQKIEKPSNNKKNSGGTIIIDGTSSTKIAAHY